MSAATNDIAGDEVIDDARPCLCKGIQHPKLTDPKNEAFCRSNVKLACLNGRWHSSQCHFIVDDKGEKEKNRCSKCKNAHGNIRRDRYPQLFQTTESSNNDQTNNNDINQPGVILSEAAAAAIVLTNSSDIDEAAQPTTTTTIDDLIFSDVGGVQKRILELLSSDSIEEEDNDLSNTAELAAVANCLRIKGELVLPIDEQRVFVACDGEGCGACFVKYARSNFSRTCKRCICNKFLFIIEGTFPEVNNDKSAAINSISLMIQRFGGKVQGRMTKKTSKYYSIYSLRISSVLVSHNLTYLIQTIYL